MAAEPDPRITAILALYHEKGHSNYYGEKVSKTDHMLQAALSAQGDKETERVVLACLLHDVGHLLGDDDMGGLGVRDHGGVGARYLRRLGVDDGVCALVEHHAEAKRYLVSTRTDYYAKLSDASRRTLAYQGGRMSKEECGRFEQRPYFREVLRVRHHDDAGKRVGMAECGIESFVPLIRRFLSSGSVGCPDLQ